MRVADDGLPALDAFETIQITVNEVNLPPLAVNDAYGTLENTPAVLDVRANDSDPDGNAITVTQVTVPLHGSATTDGATILYTPTTGYLGVDTFQYTLSDGLLTDIALVTITVASPCAGDQPERLRPRLAAPGAGGCRPRRDDLLRQQPEREHCLCLADHPGQKCHPAEAAPG